MLVRLRKPDDRLLACYGVIVLLLFDTPATARQSHSLNGTWSIVFDESNQGRREDWHEAGRFWNLAERRQIKLLTYWEIIKKGYKGVARYFHKFDVPPAWKHQFIRPRFGAVNYSAQVWINSLPVGSHEGDTNRGHFQWEMYLVMVTPMN